MSTNFDHIAIIYNPTSTGDAPQKAEAFLAELKKHKVMPEAVLTHTKYRGHARDLGLSASKKYKRPLLISVSGDGAYNELINGVIEARTKYPDSDPVTAVIGAGNANDHRRVVYRQRPLLEAMLAGAKPQAIDVLKLEATADDFHLERYAHSYIGLGISPQVGAELNKHDLTWYREVEIVLRTFYGFKPFWIQHNDSPEKLDSLLFMNITEMAKYLKMTDTNSLHDGQFEIVKFRHENKFSLLYHLLRAALRGVQNPPKESDYSFVIETAQPVQLDGEIEDIPAGTTLRVIAVPNATKILR
jgi:diacylglycerol kinase (ATP)